MISEPTGLLPVFGLTWRTWAPQGMLATLLA